MASTFCPTCGTRRVGAFRYCRSCQFDFDSLDVEPAIAAPIAPPASFEMVAPPAAPAAVTAMPRATTSSTEVAASAETGSGAVSTSTTSSRVEIVMLRAIAVIMVIVMIAAFVGVITGTLTVR